MLFYFFFFTSPLNGLLIKQRLFFYKCIFFNKYSLNINRLYHRCISIKYLINLVTSWMSLLAIPPEISEVCALPSNSQIKYRTLACWATSLYRSLTWDIYFSRIFENFWNDLVNVQNNRQELMYNYCHSKEVDFLVLKETYVL